MLWDKIFHKSMLSNCSYKQETIWTSKKGSTPIDNIWIKTSNTYATQAVTFPAHTMVHMSNNRHVANIILLVHDDAESFYCEFHHLDCFWLSHYKYKFLFKSSNQIRILVMTKINSTNKITESPQGRNDWQS